MRTVETTSRATAEPSGPPRRAARWMVTFAGFPLGGLAAEILVGRVDAAGPAIVGGLVTGAVVGAFQGWGLRLPRNVALGWAAATAVGLMTGLWFGSALAGYRTDLAALVLQGAICGIAVGLPQAFLLRPLVGRLAFGWPPVLGAIWATGWAVTAGVGVQVDQQFTVFGSSGALVVTALTAVLALAVHRPVHPDQERPS